MRTPVARVAVHFEVESLDVRPTRVRVGDVDRAADEAGLVEYLLGGERDHITPPAQVFALGDACGTPPEQIRTFLSTGGHLGLFMGSEALREHWPVLLADVRKRS